MKNNYINSLIFGIMCLTINMGPSQNILFDGDLNLTTEIISFDSPAPATIYSDNVKLQDISSATLEKIVIAGTFQSALNCAGDWDPNCDYTELTFSSSTGLYTGTFQIPAGNNRYKVTVGGSWDINYGENGIRDGADIFLCVPSGSEEITFTYDPLTNLVTTSPVTSGFSPDCLPLVVIAGTFQDELGCIGDWVPDCTNTALIFNSVSGLFEGDLNIPTGCYEYRVVLENSWQNSFGQEGMYFGQNYIISIPANPELTHFTYDPVSHIVISTPYSNAPQEVTKVSLNGTLQDELGCAFDYEYECDSPALVFNPDSGAWEGAFTLPAGCYTYRVKETFGCNIVSFYGENGVEEGNTIQLYVPTDGEITFSYNPQTHIVSSIPNNSAPQEVTKVSLNGTLQDELGCAFDYEYECDSPALVFNPDSGAWEGAFTLPAGCYTYRVKETFGCNIVSFYGENGIEEGNAIQLYVPTDGEITFSYDPQTHILSSIPDSGAPQELTKVSLIGTLQDELGCAYDYDYECDNPALIFNSDTGAWKGTFTLPAGCYTYWVKETLGCIVALYGENGIEWGNQIELYFPSDGEVTFSYDPQTHIMSSTPNSGAPQELTKVSLIGTLQDELGCAYDYDYECNNPALLFNPDIGAWEGSFTLSAGCYTYRVKETFGCNILSFYGENGIEWGNEIQLYVPSDGEITFSYNPQTHILSSTPYSGAAQGVAKVSLIGTLQDELGCDYDYDYECDIPALMKNEITGKWEGSFTLPSGCYKYSVQKTDVCGNISYYSDNGISGMNGIQLIVPSPSLITFTFDPQTNIINSTPYNGTELGITNISLYGTFQTELGCANDYDYACDIPALTKNEISGKWEGNVMLPAGCYSYLVKETVGCNDTNYYGENGEMYGNFIELYIPSDGEITFRYDPQTHIIISTPYTDISTLNQCPNNISVNNSPGSCGAIVNYPEFVATANCGGDILSITQTEGLPSGSYFPIGTTTNSFLLTKITGEEITCSFNVVVIDTESPVISNLNQNYEPLWPPNHKMVPVFIDYFATDNCNIATTELSISSNEPENGLGDGDQAPDWEILDEHNVLLRAERSRKGDGREYYITIKVTDDSGNFTEQIVTITVPHDNGITTEKFSKPELGNNEFILYPNGADNIINIKALKTSPNPSYIIYDMFGIIKKTGTLYNDQIDVRTLPSGIYFLKYEMDKEYFFKKFIKN